jgi:hypothetical protein
MRIFYSFLTTLGVEIDMTENNLKLSREGEKICEFYLRATLQFWYPTLPDEGIK